MHHLYVYLFVSEAIYDQNQSVCSNFEHIHIFAFYLHFNIALFDFIFIKYIHKDIANEAYILRFLLCFWLIQNKNAKHKIPHLCSIHNTLTDLNVKVVEEMEKPAMN